MADQYVKAQSGDDPTTDAFWIALGLTPPANKANWSGAGTDLNTAYNATSGTSDILHVAPGTYAVDPNFNSSTKAQEIKIYGDVTIDGQNSARIINVQNGLKTFSKGLGSTERDKIIVTGDGTTHLMRPEGTGRCIFECDFEINDPSTTSNASIPFYVVRSSGNPMWVIFRGEVIINSTEIDNSSANVAFSMTDSGTAPMILAFLGGVKINGNYEYIFDTNAATPSSNFTATITGVTRADPCVVTATNTFAEGQPVYIHSLSGITQLNGQWFLATNVSGSNFELNTLDGNAVDASDNNQYDAYTSGGTAFSPCAILLMPPPNSKTNQVTGRARFLGRLSNANWDIGSATGNRCEIYDTTLLPNEWEVNSRVNVNNDDIMNLASGANFYAESCNFTMTPQYNPVQVDPGGYHSSSKYVSESFRSSRLKARRKVYVSLHSDDWWDTFDYLATQTIDTRVKATLGIAYTQPDAFDLRVADATINEISVPGSTSAGAGQGYSATSVVTNFWTPAQAHINNGHEVALHSGRHSQLGYAELINITYAGNVSVATDYDGGTGTIDFTSGTLNGTSVDLTSYDEIDEVVTALAALSGVTSTVNNQGSDRSKFAGPLTLATMSATDATAGITLDRDWTSTWKDEVLHCYTTLNAQLTGSPSSFLYPVGWMSNELIAIMEDDTSQAPLVGGRQVFPSSSGVSVDQIKSPYFKPLDNGWEPFRSMCVNAGSSYGQVYPEATKTQVMESIRRYVEWFKWHGGLFSLYSHSLSEMTIKDENRWAWIIEALKPYADAGDIQYVTFSQGCNAMKQINSAVKSANGRGNNDIYNYTLTDQRSTLEQSSGSSGGGHRTLSL